jgi:hypothetical protein
MQKIIRVYAAGAMLFTALALSACTAPTVSPPAAVPAAPPISTAAPAPGDPFAAFEQARAAGQEVLAIDHLRSVVAITVRRGGTLARLGHDHVIASHELDGYVAPSMQKAALRFKLGDMAVDEAALRAQAGLPPPPSTDAIFATRRNMLERVLEVEKYPVLVVQAEQAQGNPALLNADVTLHGATRRYSVPVTIERKDGALRTTGSFTAKQSDFGIKPFSVLGGALAVEDQIELRFDISAR